MATKMRSIIILCSILCVVYVHSMSVKSNCSAIQIDIARCGCLLLMFWSKIILQYSLEHPDGHLLHKAEDLFLRQLKNPSQLLIFSFNHFDQAQRSGALRSASKVFFIIHVFAMLIIFIIVLLLLCG